MEVPLQPTKILRTPAVLPVSCSSARKRRVLRTALFAALWLALPAFHASARAEKHPKASAKTAAKKTPALRRKLPPLETVSGLTRRLAALERAEERKRQGKSGEKDSGEEKTSERHAERRGERESPGADYLGARLFRLKQRAYPNDTVNWSAYPRARKHSDAMPSAQRGGNGIVRPNITTGKWRFVGPNNLVSADRLYTGPGAVNGRVNALAYDPTTPGTYYAATASGGLFRTTDSGATFTPLSDSWPTLETNCIAIDPTNHNTIYVGTGDFDGSGMYPTGIMKTIDGGVSWTNIGKAQFGGCDVAAIAIDPETPQIVTVAAGYGPNGYAHLWRSTDGGTTWTSVISVSYIWSSLSYSAKDATGKRHLYAVGEYNNGAVYRSDDRGATWTKLSPPLTSVNYYDQNSLKIAASANDPTKVYLLDGHDQKIYMGTNLGATWTNITHNFLNGQSGDPAYNWSQAEYDAHIECGSRLVGTTPTDVIYVGLLDIEQSLTGGASWQSLGGPVWTNNALLHTDQHALTLNPNGSGEALIGNDGGIYRLTDNLISNVYSYKALNPIGAATQFYHIAAHPTNPNYLLGGAQDNATAALLNNSAAWQDVVGGDGGFCAIRDTNTQFGTAEYLYINQTSNAWASSFYISPDTGTDNVNFIAPIALDPTGTYLYAGTNYLYRYTISTGIWDAQLGGTALGDALATIALAPSDPNMIFTGASDGSVYWSYDAGQDWIQINNTTNALPTRSITSISVSPSVSTSALVGVSGTGTAHLWLCSDVSALDPDWVSVSGAGVTGLPDIPLNAIARDPFDSAKTWYVATDVGVFGTTNAGASWTNMTAPLGLPNVETDDLKAVAGTSTLYAGTYGRGIWAIGLTQSVLRVISGVIQLDSIPDPTKVSPASPIGPLTMEFRTVGGGPIYTRTVTLPANGAFSVADIPPGNYTVAVKAPKWLRALASANATSGNVSGVSLFLPGGDANNDNSVDSTDFGLLVSTFNTVAGSAAGGYDPAADFTCDGSIDSNDFGVLVGSFNQVGPN